MATTFSARKRAAFPKPRRLNVACGASALYTKEVLLSTAGPASSINSGMVLNVSTWLPNHCYGGQIMCQTAGTMSDLQIELLAAASFAPSTFKVRAKRMSTGNYLSSGVNLTGQKWLMLLLGD